MTTPSPDQPVERDALDDITDLPDLARRLNISPSSLERVLRTLVDDRLVYDVPDVERMLGISRRSVEELIRTGQLKSYKVLSLRKVDRAAVHEYLQSCIAS